MMPAALYQKRNKFKHIKSKQKIFIQDKNLFGFLYSLRCSIFYINGNRMHASSQLADQRALITINQSLNLIIVT